MLEAGGDDHLSGSHRDIVLGKVPVHSLIYPETGHRLCFNVTRCFFNIFPS